MGNNPIATSPVYASDEKIFVRARGDFQALAGPHEQFASGIDGYFNPNFPWVLNSTLVDFQTQGVLPQQIVLLSGVTNYFPGSGRSFAVESVSGNSITLRLPMQVAGVGQPPAPTTGLANVRFTINSLYSLIEEATWCLKNQFDIDESWVFRQSEWMYAYQGIEDLYRDFRETCVLKVLAMAYTAETRTERGDWPMKRAMYEKLAQAAMDKITIRWGPAGMSAEPNSGCPTARISR